MKKSVVSHLLCCLILFFFVTLFSCKQRERDKDREHQQTKALIPDTVALHPQMIQWMEYYEAFTISPDSFRWMSSEVLPSLTYEMESSQLTKSILHPLLKYSPDSTKVLDIFSYNLILVENELGAMHFGNEADTEVLLLDLTNHTKSRLLFVGPSVRIETGYWKDATNIVLMGMYREMSDYGYRPVLWRINLTKNEIQYFEYPRTFETLTPDFLENVVYQDFKRISSSVF